MLAQCKNAKIIAQCHADATHEDSRISSMPCKYNTWNADAKHEGSRISSMLCKYTIWNFHTIAQCHANATWKISNQLGTMPAQHMKVELGAMPAQHMKVPNWAQCHASAIHEGSRTSSMPCQRISWRLPNELRNSKTTSASNRGDSTRCEILS